MNQTVNMCQCSVVLKQSESALLCTQGKKPQPPLSRFGHEKPPTFTMTQVSLECMPPARPNKLLKRMGKQQGSQAAKMLTGLEITRR